MAFIQKFWVLASALLVFSLVSGLGSTFAVAASSAEQAEARRFVEDAKKYLEKGDLKAAVIQYKNALQRDPDNAEARTKLGEIYLNAGNGAAAEKELKAAKQRGVSGKSIDIKIAKAQLIQGKFEAVLKSLKDDVSDPKVRAEVLTLQGRAHAGLREVEPAMEKLREAEKLGVTQADTLVAMARLLIGAKKPDEAEEKIDTLINTNKANSDAYALKGEIRRIKKDSDGAMAGFDRAVSLDKNNFQARLGRAAVLIDKGKEDDAQFDIQAILQRNPRHPLANYLSAVVLSRKRDFVGAQEALQLTGNALDDHMPAIFLKGAVAYASDQLEQAATHLNRFVSANPDNAQAIKLYGAILVRNKEIKKAIEILEPLAQKQAEKGKDGKGDPQLYSLLGTAYMRSGNYEKSSEYFEQAALAAPKASSIRTQLALSRLALGGADKAVGDLRAAIDIDPDAKQAPILLTLVHLRKGEFDEALKLSDQLKKTMPDNPLAMNLIGAAQLGKGLKDEARKTFEKALALKSDFHPARMNLAQMDVQADNLPGAIENYQAVIASNPKHVGAMLALARIAERQDRPNDAVAWLRKAADAAPASLVPNLRLVQFYRSRGENRKALATARALSSKKPDDPQVLELLGRTELDARQPEAAILTFRRLTNIVPKNPRAHQLLGAVLLGTNDPHGARASFNQALVLNPNFAPAINALVNLEAREKNFSEAIKLTEKLKATQPNSPAADALAGDVYARAGDLKNAMAAYQRAAAIKDDATLAMRRFNIERRMGDDPDAALNTALSNLQSWVDKENSEVARQMLATNYIVSKRYDDAIREWNKVLEANPKNAIALNNLAWLYDQQNDSRAVDMAEKALAAAPKSPAIMDTLGWILSKRGNTERALELLGNAHRGAPRQGDIAYHYAVTQSKAGQREEAKRTLQRFFVKNSDAKFSKMEDAKKLLKELGG